MHKDNVIFKYIRGAGLLLAPNKLDLALSPPESLVGALIQRRSKYNKGIWSG
jgi:hypothetical protein